MNRLAEHKIQPLVLLFVSNHPKNANARVIKVKSTYFALRYTCDLCSPKYKAKTTSSHTTADGSKPAISNGLSKLCEIVFDLF